MSRTPVRLGPLALLLLVGCVASGLKLSAVQPSFPRLADNHGRIYFYRTANAFGIAMQASIQIDGTMVGRSRPGGVFYVDVPEGKHTIRIPTQSFGSDNEMTVRIEDSEVIYVRTWIGGSAYGGRTNMEVVSPEDARRVARDLAYTGGETSTPD